MRQLGFEIKRYSVAASDITEGLRLEEELRHDVEPVWLRPTRSKDTYISLALTNGVSLTWLSEQTGVAVATILKQYDRFMHSSEADALELAKIAGSGARTTLEPPQFGRQCSIAERFTEKTLHFFSQSLASPTGFEPVLPT